MRAFIHSRCRRAPGLKPRTKHTHTKTRNKKRYEEARVALTTLLFTIPCCILIGVEYGVFMQGALVSRLASLRNSDFDLLGNYRDHLYAAVCFSVINSIDKLLRISMVDPWLHPKVGVRACCCCCCVVWCIV